MTTPQAILFTTTTDLSASARLLHKSVRRPVLVVKQAPNND